MATATANPYQTAGRLTKAHRLACHLHRHDITAEEAERITGEQWAQMARIVGVNVPSAETVALTIRQLAEFERERP